MDIRATVAPTFYTKSVFRDKERSAARISESGRETFETTGLGDNVGTLSAQFCTSTEEACCGRRRRRRETQTSGTLSQNAKSESSGAEHQ